MRLGNGYGRRAGFPSVSDYHGCIDGVSGRHWNRSWELRIFFSAHIANARQLRVLRKVKSPENGAHEARIHRQIQVGIAALPCLHDFRRN